MDAPTYPPSTRFVAPVRQPRALDTHQVSVADLMAVPAVRAIILQDMPVIQYALDNADIQPHLSNLTLRDLVLFGLATNEGIAKIDGKLAKMEPIS